MPKIDFTMKKWLKKSNRYSQFTKRNRNVLVLNNLSTKVKRSAISFTQRLKPKTFLYGTFMKDNDNSESIFSTL